MKTFLYSIPNTIQSFSKKLDVKSVLCGKSWDIFNDEGVKQLFIFNKDETIHISNNGKVINASWKYITQNSSILITIDEETIMFRPVFFNKDVIMLQRDGTELYLFMIDEQRKASFALFTLEAIIKYIEKEITLASMSPDELKKLRENEEKQRIEDNKRVQDERRKQAKQVEKELIINYIREHKEDISHKINKRKKLRIIGPTVCLVLILMAFLINNLIALVCVPALVVLAFVLLVISFSSCKDIISSQFDSGIIYHTDSEVQEMYEEL